MSAMKRAFLFSVLLVCLSVISGFGQIQQDPVAWKATIAKGGGDTLIVSLSAEIKEGWHINSQFNAIKDGPLPTAFVFERSSSYTLAGETAEPKPSSKIEDAYDNQVLYYFEKRAVFRQKIIPTAREGFTFGVAISYMACSSTMCLPPETRELRLSYGLPVISGTKGHQDTLKGSNAGWIFLGGFVGGFLALLTPCVFSMIPLTVAYFTKNGGLKKALLYAASIVILYVVLGLAVTLTLGPDALNALASNGMVNLAFFLIFALFALSFLGAFEISLPSGWLNSSDRMAGKGGMAGIFFMALTLALVSFSCTGPIIGSLLVEAAVNGSIAGPAIGMLGFALALSIPFLLFAAFPGMLMKLPRSGSWLGRVKVILGFLELALALKFLSNFDLVYQLGLLHRELFIAVWIVIFSLLGLYLLGMLKLDPYDAPSHTPVSGLIGALMVFSFVVYLIPGLWGAPLKLASGFLPPSFYKEWTKADSAQAAERDKTGRSHTGSCPQDLNCFHDYEQGLAYAKEQNKPILLDFTGWSCVNCRKMEDNVWSEPKVWEKLNSDYVLISLYVDDTTPLPESEQSVSATTGKKIKTIGNKWSDFQTSKFLTNSQPYYVVMDTNGNVLNKPVAYEPDPEKYAAFLQQGIDNFK